MKTVFDPRIQEITQYYSHSFKSLLYKLVELESPSHKPEYVDRVLDLLQAECQQLGYRTFRYPSQEKAGQLLAYPKERVKNRSNQLLLGHCDTVWDTGMLENMPLYEHEDLIYGPGIYDMKAGVAMIITALNILQELEIEPAVTPVLLFTGDEETDSEYSKNHITMLARLAERVFVLEPSLGEKGLIKTTRKGVGHYRLIIKGRASHAGLEPEKGRSAILELSYLIQKLFALNNAQNGITVNVGTVDGGIRPNVIAPESSAMVDVRVNKDKDARLIHELISDLKPTDPDFELRVEGGFERPPMEFTPRNKQLWKMVQSLAPKAGLTIESGKSGGASDGNFTSRYTATLDGLGAVGGGAHAKHEHIHFKKTLKRLELLTLLIMQPSITAGNNPNGEKQNLEYDSATSK